MITYRTAKQCGHADYGWLQARYTFSFGHYFDPCMLGYAALRVLNQEVLAPGAAFQPRTYPRVDILNLILQGQAEYRDSEGHHTLARTGDVIVISAQPGVNYSEHNIGDTALTRMQLWLDACPGRDNPAIQRLSIDDRAQTLLASPDGCYGSAQLRQQAWIRHIALDAGQRLTQELTGARAYLQSIHGSADIAGPVASLASLTCGDGAFIHDERQVRVHAQTPLRALLIELAS
ncbi:pirin family protein [Martelella alba]|uniref:Pirin family protein n=1 Tax=Martelella alba TaxID=2590451 RepID=A0ABY2SMA4_9HYPH|nr:pirin family protein [Martelella alba]TKI06932.1 pirin family protein [Martelella alba]